jgi:hypothetical protein
MKMSKRSARIALGLTLLSGAAALHAQPQLFLISGAAAPGGVSAQDVTPDGVTVVGTSDGRAFRWTEVGGVEFLTASDFLHTFDASVSDDGAVVASTLVNPVDNIVSAATWTQGGGWSFLGCLPGVIPTPEDPAQCSTAYDISGDAAVVVGLAWHGDTFRAEGFRWTSGSGMVGLGQPAGFSSRASAVSADGTVSGGFYEDESTGQRRPVRWIGTGAPDLFIDPQSIGEVSGISSNGHWLTGSALLLDSGGLPLPPWNYEKAFLYSDDAGFQYVLPHVDYDIGTEQRASGNGVADNGMVVGWSGDMGPFGLVRAAIYCPGTERMVDLNQMLLDDGTVIPPNIWLGSALAVTPNGRTVVGQAIDFGTFENVPFVVRFDADPCALPSVIEIPTLDGLGFAALALALAGAALVVLRRSATAAGGADRS